MYITNNLTIVDVGVFVLFVIPRATDLISLPLRELLAGTKLIQTSSCIMETFMAYSEFKYICISSTIYSYLIITNH